ncbi:MAG TPA: hypothetical protein VF857_07760 [Spirochaetota bacterium]
MELCKNCSNKSICSKKGATDCEHYDVAFTRSEIINMILNIDVTKRKSLLDAVERTYKIKMAF